MRLRRKAGAVRRRVHRLIAPARKWKSQVGQDVFASTAAARTGVNTYIDIGAGHPQDISNTFSLERDHGWKGYGVELEPHLVDMHELSRQNPCFVADALTFDYERFRHLVGHSVVGFLSIDIEPPEGNLEVLNNFPFEALDVLALSFEHDSYRAISDTANLSRELLNSKGFVCVAENVEYSGNPFEDWWVSAGVADDSFFDELRGNLKTAKYDASFLVVE